MTYDIFGRRFHGQPIERPLVPVISQRAYEVLAPIVGGHVEFLPFHALRGKAYYAMNVLAVEDGSIGSDQRSYILTKSRKASWNPARSTFFLTCVLPGAIT